MKAYLDNNVWVDIEYGNYSIEAFRQVDIEYFFSDNLVEELLEAEGNPMVSPQMRLKMIDSLCGQNFILAGSLNKPDLTVYQSAFERYSELQKPLYRQMRNNIKKGQIEVDKLDRERLLKLFGLRRIEMNNIAPVEILGKVDILLEDVNINGVNHYLLLCEAQGRAVYLTLFNLLDYLCYWPDKKTERSAIARCVDASHAYSAQVCDYLITNDKRMIAKAQAVYSYLGVNTKVLAATDFLKVLNE